jgi:hypothetical protein
MVSKETNHSLPLSEERSKPVFLGDCDVVVEPSELAKPNYFSIGFPYRLLSLIID